MSTTPDKRTILKILALVGAGLFFIFGIVIIAYGIYDYTQDRTFTTAVIISAVACIGIGIGLAYFSKYVD
jgi:hypothetical protein